MIGKDRSDTYNKIIDIVSEKLNIDKSVIVGSASLEDLGADSLDIVEIIMKLEEEFDIEINDEEAGALDTLDKVTDYVHSLRI